MLNPIFVALFLFKAASASFEAASLALFIFVILWNMLSAGGSKYLFMLPLRSNTSSKSTAPPEHISVHICPSNKHVEEHPSPLAVFPSSHCSPDSLTPFPHTGGIGLCMH